MTTNLKKLIRDYPDFPKKGIIFKDILPILQRPEDFSELIEICRRLIYKLDSSDLNDRNSLINWRNKYMDILTNKYSTDLYSISIDSVSSIPKVLPIYSDEEKFVDGRIIIRDNFDQLLENNSKIFIFGEDVGKIGDVNQGLEGLQKKAW